MMLGVRVHGVSKQFGPVEALRGVELIVEPGEIVVLLGPNGAGKSTLLRILSTTVLPDAGQAVVAGHDVSTEAPAVRRSIGLMLGDERSWYWRISGRRNLEFFASLHGLARESRRAKASKLLEEFGLIDAADRRVDAYSSGMKARLSLARALLTDPPVLLLDEPTQNLDPAMSASFRETLVGLAEERRTAVLLVTHDLHEAERLASRIVGLVRGRIAFTLPHGTSPGELEEAFLAAAS